MKINFYLEENNKNGTHKCAQKSKIQEFFVEGLLTVLAARSVFFFSNAAALFSPLINSGFSARHWAVSSPRNAFIRIDCARLLTRENALSGLNGL